MKILFIGDIVGQPGRRAVKELLPVLKKEHDIQVVIANSENAAGGSGITPAVAQEIYDAGVDVITMGDHLWDQKEVTALLQNEPRFVRPLNYPAGVIGQGSTICQLPGLPPVAVMNVQGRTFMPDLENPFSTGKAEIEKLRQTTPIIFVDFHGEATSEKIAFGRMCDGRVSAVIGTHTHVQTADEQIFPGGTAFMCDAGFTGAQESILGREIQPILERFLKNTPQRFGVASGNVKLNGAVIDVDETTGRAREILRISKPLIS